jgi:hypothetical protein
MPPFLLVVLIAAGAVALLGVGYSITYFFRGRHMQTDVGDNDEMKKRGLRCTSQQIREHEAALRGVDVTRIEGICPAADCDRCEKNPEHETGRKEEKP